MDAGRWSTLLPRRVLYSLIFFLVLLAGGVVGFALLEHESLLDALLTTISAVSTVGYSPPRPLDAAGKIFAILLIVAGLFGSALVISVMTDYFVEGHLFGAWEGRRMDRAINALHDHFIVAGFGRVGREVSRILRAQHIPFVVVDVNPEPIAAAAAAGLLYLDADATQDEVLERLGIHRARGLIACSDSDVNNVYVTLTARSLNAGIYIVARAAQPDAEPKLLQAGANRVVSPYVMAGRQMAELAAHPALDDTMNVMFDGQPFRIGIRELVATRESGLAGHTIAELHRTALRGAFVLALDRDGQRLLDVPADERVQPGDRLLVAGGAVTDARVKDGAQGAL